LLEDPGVIDANNTITLLDEAGEDVSLSKLLEDPGVTDANDIMTLVEEIGVVIPVKDGVGGLQKFEALAPTQPKTCRQLL